MPYLVAGSTPPDPIVMDEFFEQARRSLSTDLPDTYQVRWIGANHESTDAILAHIRAGDKTGTVSLPWVAEKRGCEPSKAGHVMILINFDGSPAVLLRITKVQTVAYEDIALEHTSLDGPSVRALDIWLPLHTPYFEMLVKPYGLTVTDAMPIWFETFELLYPPAD